MTDIFISYRRTQTFIVDRIAERIRAAFPRASLFLDRAEFKPGMDFPARTEQALGDTKILLAIIDPTWAAVQDPVSLEQRIKLDKDWVRIEIERALAGNKVVIPVLVEGATMPTEEQLPDTLVALVSRQYVEIHNDYFAEDMNTLIAEMRAEIGRRKLQQLFEDDSHPYPKSPRFRPVAIKGAELAQMKADLPRWEIVKSPLKDDTRPGAPRTRLEMVRRFKFPSFLAAIAFMSEAAKRIDPYDHHPRWENKFRTVEVALSTWDSGHRISDRDYKTARMLERFYKEFIEELWNADTANGL